MRWARYSAIVGTMFLEACAPTVGTLERLAVRLAVICRGRLGRDVAVDHVVPQPCSVALGGRPEASRAGRAEPDLGAGRRREGALAVQLPLGAVGADHRDAPGAAGAAAGEPEGRGLGALEAHAGLGGAVQDAPHALDPAAAAVPAGAPAVGH